MKKLFQFYKSNVLLVVTIALLAFIPLYPKLPLIDVRYTWVYIRLEDFVVLAVLFLWVVLLVRKKVSVKTPLTTPILLFWVAGLIATIHGVAILSPSSGTLGNVGFLSFLRRIEYMSMFFVAFAAVRQRRFLTPVVAVLALTVLAVSVYGVGQKYLGFPAYLTMNEEFAKGIPIRLSSLSRVSSTFSGHYDLAAYMVLTIPILISMAFGLRRWLARFVLFVVSIAGLAVLFMTVSRISLFAFVVAAGLVLFMHRRRLVVIAIPAVLFAGLLVAVSSPRILDRFTSTVKEIDVVVDAVTGEAIGQTKHVPKAYFADKAVTQVFSTNVNNLYAHASPSAARIIPHTLIEDQAVLYVEPNAPTGEDLPQGTGYVNLPLAPVTGKIGHFYFEPTARVATTSAQVYVINGTFLIKRALAYDLSFTTRFQGQWPRALDAFKRNILIGSGYGSVGLAVDNSYLRMLAEVGLLGVGAFLAIFVIAAISIRKALKTVGDAPTRSFVIGFTAGVAGLAFNALFIDVFEASKIAFTLWLLAGVALGTLGLSGRGSDDVLKGLTSLLFSPVAIVTYLFVFAFVLYAPMLENTFVGDDYTWLRWAATGKAADWYRPFIDAGGFFYRPGAKLYFTLMYSLFWLNQSAYHAVSLMLHFIVSVFVFFLARKLYKNVALSALVAAAFLLLAGHAEAIFWVSATGFLFTAAFSLLSLLSFIAWQEKGKTIHFFLTLASLILAVLFHELGIVTPLFFLWYTIATNGWQDLRQRVSNVHHALLFSVLPLYLLMRFVAGSHWFSGDYNYNLVKLPFNAAGNAIGYALLTFLGPSTVPFVHVLRNVFKANVAVAALATVALLAIIVLVYMKYILRLYHADKRIVFFGIGFFTIALLPFLGLGNMASRYAYLASVGAAIFIVFLFKTLYQYLLENGRIVAALVVVLASGTLLLFQLIQHQQIRSDWREAAVKTKRFIIAIDGSYEDNWATEPIELHFVNVPIRSGEAWVFPVGLSDALWLIFRNPALRVFSWPSVASAFDAVDYESAYQRVFAFDESGKLVEHRKIRVTQ